MRMAFVWCWIQTAAIINQTRASYPMDYPGWREDLQLPFYYVGVALSPSGLRPGGDVCDIYVVCLLLDDVSVILLQNQGSSLQSGGIERFSDKATLASNSAVEAFSYPDLSLLLLRYKFSVTVCDLGSKICKLKGCSWVVVGLGFVGRGCNKRAFVIGNSRS